MRYQQSYKQRITRLLQRTGLEAAVRWALRILRNPRNLRFDLDVAADYRAFKRRYGPIFRGGRELADPRRKVLFLSFADSPVQVKAESFLAKILQVHGVTPVMVTASWLTRARQYYRAFGLDQIAFFDHVRQDLSGEAAGLIEDLFSRPLTMRDLRTFTYKGTRVGSHVLRTFTRTTFQGSVDVASPQAISRLRSLLQESMHNVDRAEVLLEELQPEVIFSHHPLNIGEGDIFDAALVRGIPSTYWVTAQKANHWIFKRYSNANRDEHYLALSEDAWQCAQQMPWTEEHEAALTGEIRARYDDASGADMRRLQHGKQIMGRAAVQQELGLDPGKRTAVIFSHITWDTSFLYGTDLFDDYEQWLVETTRAACANPAINWIIKLHPANRFYKAREPGLKHYSDVAAIRAAVGELPEHVRLLYPETDINTWSLFDLTDYCLTVRGTIGIEMAAFGIPVLTAGSGRYAGRGFTVDSASREEYLGRLAHIQDQLALSPEQVDLAKKHAYWVFVRRPVKLDIVEVMLQDYARRSSGHPFHTNYAFRIDRLEEMVESSSLLEFAEWVLQGDSSDFYRLS